MLPPSDFGDVRPDPHEEDPVVDAGGVCFARRLRELVNEQGGRRARARLQRELGISASTLSQYMSGAVRPSFERLVRLSELLEVTLDDLVFARSAPRIVPVDPVPGDGAAARWRRFEREARARAELVQRVGRELARSIGDAVDGITLRGGLPRVLDDEDSFVLEGFSRRTQTLGLRLDYLVRKDDGEGGSGSFSAGPFLERVARNLDAGHSYTFVLAEREGSDWTRIVTALGALLSERFGLAASALARCRFHRSSVPVGAAFVLYELDGDRLRRTEPFLHELVREHLSADGWLGAVQPPSSELGLDLLMDRPHLEHAREVFEAVMRARGTKPIEAW